MMRRTDDVRTAAQTLLDGHVVLLPTETVYGIAARADEPAAVAQIYRAKGRPLEHPLIVHVADAEAALAVGAPGAWASFVPDYARELAAQLWPGPLTLVLPRTARAIDQVTGGQDTVALRVPRHPLARAIIAAMDELDPDGAPHGVAAPSANRFGRVSPTTVDDAVAELAGCLDDVADIAVDGGPCDVGVESTIVDCTGETPRILRPGGVGKSHVERITGMVVDMAAPQVIRVPGLLPSHYAPDARVILAADAAELQDLADVPLERGEDMRSIGVIAPSSIPTPAGAIRLAAPVSAREYAHDLYAALREADRKDIALVIAVPPEDDFTGLGEAILDRLNRAAAPRQG